MDFPEMVLELDHLTKMFRLLIVPRKRFLRNLQNYRGIEEFMTTGFNRSANRSTL